MKKKKKTKPVTPPFCEFFYQSLSQMIKDGTEILSITCCSHHFLLLFQPIFLGHCPLPATPDSGNNSFQADKIYSQFEQYL